MQSDFSQSIKRAAPVWGRFQMRGVVRPPLWPASFVTFLSGKEKYKEKQKAASDDLGIVTCWIAIAKKV